MNPNIEKAREILRNCFPWPTSAEIDRAAAELTPLLSDPSQRVMTDAERELCEAVVACPTNPVLSTAVCQHIPSAVRIEQAINALRAERKPKVRWVAEGKDVVDTTNDQMWHMPTEAIATGTAKLWNEMEAAK